MMTCKHGVIGHCPDCALQDPGESALPSLDAQPDWKAAALRLGEQLADTGPVAYYEFTPARWLDWCERHLPARSPTAECALGAESAVNAQDNVRSSIAPKGESRWLIETSELGKNGGPDYPKRHFWTGKSWHWNALEAARYPTQKDAEHVAEKEELYPRFKYPVCEHLFQCGVSARQTYDAVADAVTEIADAAAEAFEAAGLVRAEWDGDDLVKDVKRGIVQDIEVLAKLARSAAGQSSTATKGGVGLSVYEADVIAAAVKLAPLLEKGWDDQDTPEDQNEGAKACDLLVAAVNKMLSGDSPPSAMATTHEAAIEVCCRVRDQLSAEGNPIWHGAQRCVMALCAEPAAPTQDRIDAEEACRDIFNDFAEHEIKTETTSVRNAWAVGKALSATRDGGADAK